MRGVGSSLVQEPDLNTKPEPSVCRQCGEPAEASWVIRKWWPQEQCEPCREIGASASYLADEIRKRWHEMHRDGERCRREYGGNVPKAYHHASLDAYRCPPGDANALAKAKAWEPSRRGLFLYGPPGGGKSHLAFALANRHATKRIRWTDPETWPIEVDAEMVPHVTWEIFKSEAGAERERRGERYPLMASESFTMSTHDVIAVGVVSLLAELRGYYATNRGLLVEEAVSAMEGCGVLILDDLGAERGTEWAKEMLFRLIEYRASNEKPMIITSNLGLDVIAKRYRDEDGFPAGERLASRIAGSCEIIQVKAQGDYRLSGARK